MNKKLVLSVLSTAVVASMATSAFAAPKPGVYIGGSVNKFYEITTLMNLSAQAKTNFGQYIAQAASDWNQVVYVDFDGKGASIQEILDEGLTTAKADALATTDFSASYEEMNADGTVKGTYDARKDVDNQPGGELVVESVSAITTTVAENVADDQFVGFTVNNGQTVTVDALKAAGYTVEFQATKAVFDGNSTTSATGLLKDNLNATNHDFSYQVVISKDGQEFKSALVDVDVQDYSTQITEIKSADLFFNNDVKLASGKLVLNETAQLDNIAVAFKDGNENPDATSANGLKFSSSNKNVAVVSATGKITPVSTGTTTITITDASGAVKHEIPLTVVADDRVATQATVSKTSVKTVATNSSGVTVDVTVVDQYGDPVKGENYTAPVAVNNADGAKIADVAAGAVTTAEGKATLTITPEGTNVGTGTFQLKEGNTVLATISVEISPLGTVATRELELQDANKDLSLDVNPLATDSTVDLVFNKYNTDGYLMGFETTDLGIDGSTKYTVSSTDANVADVAVNNGVITVTAKKAGTAKIQVKEGAILKDEVTINVGNTSPQVTALTFAENLTITNTTPLAFADILDVANNVTLSSTGIVASEVDAVNGTVILYVDVINPGYDANQDITLGTISLVSAVVNGNVDKGVVFEADVNGVPQVQALASGDKGDLLVKFVRAGETNAFATTTISVDVQ